MEIAQTALRQNVTPVSLADALVAIAMEQPTDDLDQNAVRVAYQSWGASLDARTHNRAGWPTSAAAAEESPQVVRRASA